MKSCAVRVSRPICNQSHVHHPAPLLHFCGPYPMKLHAHSPCKAPWPQLPMPHDTPLPQPPHKVSHSQPPPTMLFHLSHPTKFHTHSPHPAPPPCSTAPRHSMLATPIPQCFFASATPGSSVLTAPTPKSPQPQLPREATPPQPRCEAPCSQPPLHEAPQPAWPRPATP